METEYPCSLRVKGILLFLENNPYHNEVIILKSKHFEIGRKIKL